MMCAPTKELAPVRRVLGMISIELRSSDSEITIRFRVGIKEGETRRKWVRIGATVDKYGG